MYTIDNLWSHEQLSLEARGSGWWSPLSCWQEGVDVCSSLETFMNMAYSHQDHFVGMNIPVIITCQGDISELGFDDCCLLLMASLICAEQSQLWWNMTYSISYKQLAIHYRQHSAYMKYFYDGQCPWWWTKYSCMNLLVKGRSNCYSIGVLVISMLWWNLLCTLDVEILNSGSYWLCQPIIPAFTIWGPD